MRSNTAEHMCLGPLRRDPGLHWTLPSVSYHQAPDTRPQFVRASEMWDGAIPPNRLNRCPCDQACVRRNRHHPMPSLQLRGTQPVKPSSRPRWRATSASLADACCKIFFKTKKQFLRCVWVCLGVCGCVKVRVFACMCVCVCVQVCVFVCAWERGWCM